jgi:hypothetical protein
VISSEAMNLRWFRAERTRDQKLFSHRDRGGHREDRERYMVMENRRDIDSPSGLSFEEKMLDKAEAFCL